MIAPASKWLTFAGIVREVYPGANDKLVNYILWEHTGYPSFWATRSPEEECRQQVKDSAAEIAERMPPGSLPVGSLRITVESAFGVLRPQIVSAVSLRSALEAAQQLPLTAWLDDDEPVTP